MENGFKIVHAILKALRELREEKKKLFYKFTILVTKLINEVNEELIEIKLILRLSDKLQTTCFASLSLISFMYVVEAFR